jgi:hypothetical protein
MYTSSIWTYVVVFVVTDEEIFCVVEAGRFWVRGYLVGLVSPGRI